LPTLVAGAAMAPAAIAGGIDGQATAPAKARAVLHDRAAVLRAVVEIARGGQVGDPAVIERTLGLPGLAAGIQWVQPPSWDRLSGPRANYDVAAKDSPIRNLHLIRGDSLYLDGREVPHDWLTIVFRNGRCPRLSDYEAAFGRKFEEMIVPAPHGGAGILYRYFEMISASGAKVTVSAEPCAIRLSTPTAVREAGGAN